MFRPADIHTPEKNFTCRWSSPSNIAIVKYWGKLPGQIPANPSVSFTLDSCRTDTDLEISPREDHDTPYDIEVWLNESPSPSFIPKIGQFFDRIADYAPYLKKYRFTLRTSNTFPHSSGIASSASGMSALALCLVNFENTCGAGYSEEDFLQRASFYARLGSGSASRSLYGGVAVWGTLDGLPRSSDLFAVPLPPERIHPVFRDLCDTVVLVEKGAKSVSSSTGHKLMENHPYAPARFEQAREHADKLLTILQSGNMSAFGQLAESEALTLHAMMMTADPYYILLKPGTVSILEKVWDIRRRTSLPLYFTLDAGANVHLLYPAHSRDKVRRFIQEELSPFCNGRFIHDTVGQGPQKR